MYYSGREKSASGAISGFVNSKKLSNLRFSSTVYELIAPHYYEVTQELIKVGGGGGASSTPGLKASCFQKFNLNLMKR